MRAGALSGRPCEPDLCGVYLLPWDRSSLCWSGQVSSVATDFKQLTACRKDNLEGIWVCFCFNQHLFDVCRELFIVYLHRGRWWWGLRWLFIAAVWPLCVFVRERGQREKQTFISHLTYSNSIMLNMFRNATDELLSSINLTIYLMVNCFIIWSFKISKLVRKKLLK